MHEHQPFKIQPEQEQQGVESYGLYAGSHLFSSVEHGADYQGHSHLGSVADKASGVAVIEEQPEPEPVSRPQASEPEIAPVAPVQNNIAEAQAEAIQPAKRRSLWSWLLRKRSVVQTPETIAAGLIESRGYARVAPRFSEMLEEPENRQNTFAYEYQSKSYRGGEATEYEGLVELRDFLAQRTYYEKAKAMLENLTFIGEKEYAEGVAGLAAYWKSFLDSDSRAQLCPLALIGTSGPLKSDKYLMERILEHFSDEELNKYKGRLVVDPALLKASPKRVKVVLLDDWIISGSQMSGAYSYAAFLLPDKYRDCRELNLLVASPRRNKEGFTSKAAPIKSYFLAHEANGPVDYASNSAYISGTHSTVDYDFRDALVYIGDHKPMLARVTRNYGEGRPQYHRVSKVKQRRNK